MIVHGHLVDEIKIDVQAPTAAGTSDVNGTVLDMTGYDGVLFIARFGTPAAGNLLKAQQDTVVGMGGAADLAGTAVASGANNVVLLDVQFPTEQFVRCVAVRGTSSTLDGVTAIRYKGRSAPITQSGASIERHVQPAEGTA